MRTEALFQNRPFLLLWASEFFLTFGFSTMMTTVSWYVVQKLGELVYLSLVLTAASLPRVIMMVVGGIVADRKQKSVILFAANLSQFLRSGNFRACLSYRSAVSRFFNCFRRF